MADQDLDEDPVGARLLTSAAEVFAERGYAGAKVAEIARRAGLTTGAIYSRYRGKAELLVEAIDTFCVDELDALFTDHRFRGHMEDLLRVAGSHLVERDDSPAPGLLLEAMIAARHEEDVAELLRRRFEDRRSRLALVVESAKASGGIDQSLDTQALVTFCHAVGLGFLLLEVLDTPMPDGARWEELIARLVAATGVNALAADQIATNP
ncbi:MAG: TetR family transcriptional regulator [Acidimicrobiales bacterium]|nr:TetR family transcriptional regulator [Acidimicrobiales bacterium]